MAKISWPEDVNQAHRGLGSSLSSSRSLLLRGFQLSRILPQRSGPSIDVLCFPLLRAEVFSPWTLPLSSSWVLLQFNQPCLILGQYRNQMKFSRAFVQSVHLVLFVILYADSEICWKAFRQWHDFLRVCSFVPSLCFRATRPSSKDIFYMLQISVVLVIVTSGNVNHCYSL